MVKLNDRERNDDAVSNQSVRSIRTATPLIRFLYGQRTKRGLETETGQNMRQLECFARIEILVRQ